LIAGLKEKLKKEAVTFDDNDKVNMLSFNITQQRPCINIFKLGGAYYFKHFFDDPELFRELEYFRPAYP